MLRSVFFIIGVCLTFSLSAETEWLVSQPEPLQNPSSFTTSQQQCDFPQQLALARRGKTEHQYQLALCYYYGLGIDVDREKARYWLKQAAARNHIKAMYQLAEFYRQQDKYHDLAQAKEWYQKAAEDDYPPAQLRLAEMYVEGQGVSQDYVEAYKWFYMAGMFGANSEPRLRGSVRRQRQMLVQKMSPQQIEQARESISQLLQPSSGE